jgi:hypothetical protein
VIEIRLIRIAVCMKEGFLFGGEVFSFNRGLAAIARRLTGQ